MTERDNLKKSIMRRVYVAWFLKKIVNPLAVKIYIIIALLWHCEACISVKNVIANAPSLTDLGANWNFFSYAFTHAGTILQLSMVFVVLFAAWLARDIVKNYFQQSTRIPRTS